MLSRLLRQILFTLVHLFLNILVAVQNVYHEFWTKKCSLRNETVTTAELKVVLEHVPKISKKLKHLTILSDTDHHSLGDLARLVIWSLVAGIPYVSFYDITGKIKENEEQLFLEVERNKKGVPGCIKWFQKPDLNGYTNGIQAHTVYLNIFTYKDGKPKIAECIRRIAEEKIICDRQSGEYTAQELDKSLKLMYPSIPDPDLVLYTGPSCYTYGLLPWHIRLSEFIQLSIDHSINVTDFVDALFRYNKCDQRFGK